MATLGDPTDRSALGIRSVGAYRDRGRWFDRFESEKRGHASGADAGKGAKHVLEFTSVNRGNVQQRVVGSCYGVGTQHIRQAVQSPCELGVTGFGMFSKGGQHEGFDAQSDLLMVNDGSDSLVRPSLRSCWTRRSVAAGESPRRRASSTLGKSPRTCNSAMITQSKWSRACGSLRRISLFGDRVNYCLDAVEDDQCRGDRFGIAESLVEESG